MAWRCMPSAAPGDWQDLGLVSYLARAHNGPFRPATEGGELRGGGRGRPNKAIPEV